MAGILDNKTRVLDAVITESGRSQISSGRLKIEYASLTDASTYYAPDEVTAADDVVMRLYFECPGQRPQDYITFETDDSGQLMGYPIDASVSIHNDELFKDNPSSGDINSLTFVSGSGDFASLSSGIVTSSIDHFKQNYLLGSANPTRLETNQFEISPKTSTFLISNSFPFDDGPEASICDINAVECLFLDKRLSHIPNFKFLPPMVVEPSTDVFDLATEKARETDANGNTNVEAIFLGSYSPLGEAQTELTYQDIINNLNGDTGGIDPDTYSSIPNQNNLPFSTWQEAHNIVGAADNATSIGAIPINVSRERSIVSFIESSEQNNIVMQMFEIDDKLLKFKKLDVIDFGEFNYSEDPDRPNKHVFFAGKIFLNDVKIPVFVNIFTIILD